jgi:hypothetical protein
MEVHFASTIKREINALYVILIVLVKTARAYLLIKESIVTLYVRLVFVISIQTTRNPLYIRLKSVI